jgi:hypothetical protein
MTSFAQAMDLMQVIDHITSAATPRASEARASPGFELDFTVSPDDEDEEDIVDNDEIVLTKLSTLDPA